MPRKGITRSQVAEAIDDLKNAGLADPSIRVIRGRLGQGSLTSIMRHKQALDEIAVKNGTEVLPDAFEVTLRKAAKKIWLEVAQAADDIVKKQTAELDKKQQQLETKLSTVDADEAVLRSQLREQEKTVRELKKSLKSSEEQVTKLEKKVSNLEGTQEGLATLKVTISTERKRHDREKKAFDKERTLWTRRLDTIQKAHDKQVLAWCEDKKQQNQQKNAQSHVVKKALISRGSTGRRTRKNLCR